MRWTIFVAVKLNLSFARKARAGTTSRCPKNKNNKPVLEVRVPRKNTKPTIKSGRVIKASPTELRKLSIYRGNIKVK